MPEPTSKQLEALQTQVTKLDKALGEETNGSPTGRDLAFLGFFGRRRTQELLSDEDSAALQNWVIQRLAKQMRFVKNPSIATRRDSGLIAALCAAPARGAPRKWPENCYAFGGTDVSSDWSRTA
jgi:hypothetical protein